MRPSGVTEAGEKDAVTPAGSGPLRLSRLSATLPPKAVAWASLTAIRKVAVAPATTVCAETSELIAKSRATVPTLSARGSCFVVRYGLPAWPLIHRA